MPGDRAEWKELNESRINSPKGKIERREDKGRVI